MPGATGACSSGGVQKLDAFSEGWIRKQRPIGRVSLQGCRYPPVLRQLVLSEL
jgi:hypothetical protein